MIDKYIMPIIIGIVCFAIIVMLYIFIDHALHEWAHLGI